MKGCKRLVLLLILWLAQAGALLADFPCSITDCLGREVNFAQAPGRVLIAGRAGFMITNAAFFFKTASAKLISYSKNFQLKDADRLYQMLDPKFSMRCFNDHETSIEELAAMQPDLVLVRNFERQKFERSLEQLGIPVIFFSLEDPATYLKEIETLGVIFGETERGAEVAAFYRSWQQKIAARLAASPKTRHPQVLHLYYSEKGGAVSFNVSPAHWIQAWLVEQAGGEAVWKSAGAGKGWQQISFDQIAAWQPEFVFVSSYSGDVDKAKERLCSDPLWVEMSAVKQQKLFAFPEDFICWDQPDSRWILGLCWLAAILNPEIAELRTDMHELYQGFFALYGFSPEQIKGITMHGDHF